MSAAKRPRPRRSGGSSSRATEHPIHLLSPVIRAARGPWFREGNHPPSSCCSIFGKLHFFWIDAQLNAFCKASRPPAARRNRCIADEATALPLSRPEHGRRGRGPARSSGEREAPGGRAVAD